MASVVSLKRTSQADNTDVRCALDEPLSACVAHVSINAGEIQFSSIGIEKPSSGSTQYVYITLP